MTGGHLTQIRRAAYFLLPPLVCLIIFWRVPLTWFLSDDFAWLGIPLEVHSLRDFLRVMFVPKAQGTVRVFSERFFFYAFSSLFGLNALPYHLWALATWFADLTLASLIGARLTGSRAAGLIAAVLWTTSVSVVTPIAWASAYNEVLCAFCILAAFYSRLRWLESGQRKWMVAEWAAYLAGFGVLEIIVMYPALAALHALCVDRKRIWKTIPLFVPAVVFTIIHFLLVPQNAGDYYNLIVDQRLPMTFLHYLGWAIGPSRLGEIVSAGLTERGRVITGAIGLALVIFIVSRVRRREPIALFCCGWFVVLLAPVLPLPNHTEDYYVTLPLAGLAWLGGWAIVTAWRVGWSGRVVAIVLAGFYLHASITAIDISTRWYFERSDRIRVLVLGLRESARAHPGSAFLLQGVDNDLFRSGFQDDPFRLLRLERVYLVGSTEGIEARADLGGLDRFRVTPAHALALLEGGQARALSVSPQVIRDVTSVYKTILRADPAATRQDFVEVGDALYAPLLGPTWYPAEGGFRWMPKTATVKLSGPRSSSAKLYVTGFAPAAALASGPVTLRVGAGGLDVGSATLRQPERQFSLEFGLPASLVGQAVVEVSLELSKTFRPGAEQRDLGMVFGTFAIR